ncbi:MAG TPA: hypothetical protein VJC09_00160 [Candidatus Saccharimonadales bacterium]|nr:hypothetical protein [Candidatus Saccharimonadales bacterium]
MDINQDEAEILEGIVKDVNEMIIETKQTRQELNEAKQHLEQLNHANKVELLDYTIQKERIRESETRANDCMKKLERQKKIAIHRLMQLN